MSWYSIGAVGKSADWLVTKYHDVAVLASKQLGSSGFSVVSMNRNGDKLESTHFSTREEATTAYDALATSPGAHVYIAVFDNADPTGNPFDEAFFSAVTETTTTKTNAVGWGAAAIAALFGLMAFGRKKGHH